jgi:hypothetical protein
VKRFDWLAPVVALALIMSFGACDFLAGPDEPVSGGNLVISLGGAGRSIGPGGKLPGDVRAALRYELTLTGPEGETLEQTVSGGETLNLTVSLGEWRIDARAYQGDGLAGTGSHSFTVAPGLNSVRVPMNMEGDCYEISFDPSITGGTVEAGFTAAFAGTEIMLTVTPAPDRVVAYPPDVINLTNNTEETVSDSGTSYTFTMPASDVEIRAGATFLQFVRYVKAGGTGDGTSWANASDDLQKMMNELAAIPSSDYTGIRIVKMGAGTYKPLYEPMVPSSPAGSYGYNDTPGDNRDKAFILRQGVQVWGGYPASGGDDSSRDITANETILSGDIGAPGNNGDNAYHVVLAMGVDRKTVLSGLTITGGNADGTGYIQVFNYNIDRNNGGGMYTGVNTNHSYSPVLVNVKISGNSAFNLGGGMYNYKAKSVLINVLVSGNTAGNLGGGMLNVYQSSPFFINVTVSGNSAVSGGGAMHNDSTDPITILNSVIWGNNSGVNGTPTISNSLVQGSSGGTDDNVADPGTGSTASPFVDWQDPASVSMPNSGGDYRLDNGSPAIDVGDNGSYPDTWAKWQTLITTGEGITSEAEYDTYIAPHLGWDMGGNTRIQGTIDMGAFERE